MKVQYRKLVQKAFVLPRNPKWIGTWLGAGTVVAVRGNPERSSAGDTQHPVTALDNVGREYDGWLGMHIATVIAPPRAQSVHFVSPDPDDNDNPIDRVLNRISLKRIETGSLWTIRDWVSTFGVDHIDLLKRVIREHGGRVTDDADTTTILTRALRTMLDDQGATLMDTQTEAPKASAKKSAAKKSSAKKSPAAKKHIDAPARSMARSAGVAALAALEKAGGSAASRSIAKKLSNDAEVGKKDLIVLRDGINEAATKAREENKPAVATALSNANRLVRRLARKG